MTNADGVVFHAVRSLHDAGYIVTGDLVARHTRLKSRSVNRALTSLARRGMIAPRRWGGAPGSYIPLVDNEDIKMSGV